MTFFLVRIKAFELIWTLWFLVTGVGIIQTGNLFRSYYWQGFIFYFFGILLIISGIIITLAESLQIWGPILYHSLFGFCWISEAVRGRKKNGFNNSEPIAKRKQRIFINIQRSR